MLSIRNLTKTYQTTKSKSKNKVVALDNVSIDFPEKGLVFLLGKSGSGKSTLLNAIGGLDTFDSGEIIIKGKSSKSFTQSDFDSYRNTFIGFIFQEYNILEEFTVAKNISLAIELQGKHADKKSVNELLEQVDMIQYAKRKPNQLSGGQKQRVAIARALIKNPEIIMADEPTGALDSTTGKQVMETLKELSKSKLVIIVSHDREFAEIYGDRIVELKDGKIIRDVTKKEVEATKTESGISIIEDRIIHIKKGQTLTKKDLDKINQILMDNTQDSDTIISLDKTANVEIKKSQSITEEGNQEVFASTEPEDIELKDYKGKKLNLIKSTLKFKDSFKMGASALKNKVGKLVFTILLSFAAFAMFGIVDTLATFNRPVAVYSTVTQTNQNKLSLLKEKKADYGADAQLFKDSDIEIIKNKFPDIKITPVIGRGSSYSSNYINLEGHSSSSSNGNNPFYNAFISGMVKMDSMADLNNLGFELVHGTLPQADNEICISKHLFDVFKNNHSDIDTYEDLIGYKDGITDEYNYLGRCHLSSYGNFKIVGIIDDETDLTKYSSIPSEELNSSKNYLLRDEIQTVLSYGYTNAIYVTTNKYNSSLDVVSDSWVYFEKHQEDDDSYSSQMSVNFEDLKDLEGFYSSFAESWNSQHRTDEYDPVTHTYKWIVTDEADYQDFINTYNIYHKDGSIVKNGSLIELGENEIMLSKERLNNWFSTDEELQTAISEGLTFDLLDKSYDPIKGLTVVGYFSHNNNYNSQDAVSNDKLKEYIKAELFTGYDYVIASLTQDEKINKDFVTFCETFSEDTKVKYTVQNSSTGVLDNFGDMFDTLSEVFLYVGIGFAVFASFLLMNFISTSISYKKREIGVLRALGARGTDVFGIFFNESLVIAAINFVLATIATFVAAFFINNAVINDLGFNLVILTVGIRQVVLILGISIIAAFIASLLPVVKIARKKPIDAINNR